jgi:hypothetical protein
MYTQVLAPCEDTGRQGAAREGGCSRQIRVRRRRSHCVRQRPPSPGLSPPNCRGERRRGRQDWGSSMGVELAPDGPPPPLRGRKGRIRLRCDELPPFALRHPSPAVWGRGRPPSRGTSERPGGGEGPRPREEAPLPAQLPSNPSENPHLRRSSGVQEFGISCRIPPPLPFASACESLACSIPMTAECRHASAQKRPWGVRRSNLSVAGPSPAWLARAVSLAHLYRSPTR